MSRTLILSDGSLASLLACAYASEAIGALDAEMAAACTPYVLAHEIDTPLTSAHVEAVRRQARAYALLEAEPGETLAAASREGVSHAERETISLITASFLAARLGCSVVVWPVVTPGARAGQQELDIERMTRAFDLARVVSRTITMQIDAPGVTSGADVAGIEVCVPYVDLTDDQIADLALDMSVPIETCWWWGGQGAAAAEHARWTRALASMGWQRSGTSHESAARRAGGPRVQ